MANFIPKAFLVLLMSIASVISLADEYEGMVRISEIEIHEGYLEEYLEILKEEAEASVRLEPGVIAIYPMYQVENPTQVRILEIYTNKKAYDSHLETPHFKKYKTTTIKMVKSLNLVDMSIIDLETMEKIFRKHSLAQK
ncbi:antibiotic biosynthesis monooxygenase [Ketobacter sp. MCCC 1A13808]|uniref:putative quinol monooxygenase n=1 Tax=Ketobacter sp. MCCC 1A13808 TaxID=2602738 RepID=UPI0012EC2743|nr:antibiotic biosynthesis monooxygenase family protein [Ketobacter sp. MCCC 1A13808]MVF14934.1 antibiotic biosynthesis monooxygenase [Ketobacter sp. MCCC 1A13808]